VLEKGNRQKKRKKKKGKREKREKRGGERKRIKQQKRVRRSACPVRPTDARDRERAREREREKGVGGEIVVEGWGGGEKSDHWCGAQITERRGRNN